MVLLLVLMRVFFILLAELIHNRDLFRIPEGDTSEPFSDKRKMPTGPVGTGRQSMSLQMALSYFEAYLIVQP